MFSPTEMRILLCCSVYEFFSAQCFELCIQLKLSIKRKKIYQYYLQVYLILSILVTKELISQVKASNCPVCKIKKSNMGTTGLVQFIPSQNGWFLANLRWQQKIALNWSFQSWYKKSTKFGIHRNYSWSSLKSSSFRQLDEEWHYMNW